MKKIKNVFRWLLVFPSWFTAWIISLCIIDLIGPLYFSLDSLISFGPDGIDIAANSRKYQCWESFLTMFLSAAVAVWVGVKISPSYKNIVLYTLRSFQFILCFLFLIINNVPLTEINLTSSIAANVGLCLGGFLVQKQKSTMNAH